MRNVILLGGIAIALVLFAAASFFSEAPDIDSKLASNPASRAAEADPVVTADENQLESESSPMLPTGELDDETEMVLGIRVKKDRNCTVQVHYLETSPGLTTKAYSCEPDETVRHPYEEYSNAALAELAYSDADAARILGIRKREDHSEALTLFARAAALDAGSPDPILYYSNLYPHPTAIDGVPVKKTILTKLMLATVADRLGADSTAIRYWEEQTRIAFDDPEQAIASAQSRAQEVLAYMRSVQITVSGYSSIGE